MLFKDIPLAVDRNRDKMFQELDILLKCKDCPTDPQVVRASIRSMLESIATLFEPRVIAELMADLLILVLRQREQEQQAEHKSFSA